MISDLCLYSLSIVAIIVLLFLSAVSISAQDIGPEYIASDRMPKRRIWLTATYNHSRDVALILWTRWHSRYHGDIAYMSEYDLNNHEPVRGADNKYQITSCPDVSFDAILGKYAVVYDNSPRWYANEGDYSTVGGGHIIDKFNKSTKLSNKVALSYFSDSNRYAQIISNKEGYVIVWCRNYGPDNGLFAIITDHKYSVVKGPTKISAFGKNHTGYTVDFFYSDVQDKYIVVYYDRYCSDITWGCRGPSNIYVSNFDSYLSNTSTIRVTTSGTEIWSLDKREISATINSRDGSVLIAAIWYGSRRIGPDYDIGVIYVNKKGISRKPNYITSAMYSSVQIGEGIADKKYGLIVSAYRFTKLYTINKKGELISNRTKMVAKHSYRLKAHKLLKVGNGKLIYFFARGNDNIRAKSISYTNDIR